MQEKSSKYLKSTRFNQKKIRISMKAFFSRSKINRVLVLFNCDDFTDVVSAGEKNLKNAIKR